MKCLQCGTEWQGNSEACPTCGSVLRRPDVQTTDGGPERRMGAKRWIVRGVVATVFIGGIVIFLDQLLRTYHPVIEQQPVVEMATMYRDERIDSVPVDATMSGGFISIPLRAVQEHKLVRFFDPEGVQETPLIAYITPQGRLVTAISRSEHCGSTDFYLRGSNIHCAACPSYWNMASLEAYACCQKYYPDPIPSTVVGDMVRIDPNAVRSWKSRL